MNFNKTSIHSVRFRCDVLDSHSLVLRRNHKGSCRSGGKSRRNSGAGNLPGEQNKREIVRQMRFYLTLFIRPLTTVSVLACFLPMRGRQAECLEDTSAARKKAQPRQNALGEV